MPNRESTSPQPKASAQFAMTLRERSLWLVALLVVQSLYFPINRTAQGGTVLRIPPVDDLIPVWPVWVIPYLLSLVWWVACYVWAAWKMEDSLFRALMLASIMVMLSSYAVYLVFPTYVVRRAVVGEGFFPDLLRLLYSSDRAYNAFPSGHTCTAVLIALFWWRWQPRLRWLWVAVAAIVVLSTLFTGQHHSPDLLGAIFFAWLGYRFGLWWVEKRHQGG